MGIRTQIIQMLDDTHILVVDDSPVRELLLTLFAELGANVHHAETQMQAVGMYFRLFRQRMLPRAVVCDWYLSPPASAEHKFMAKYMTDEVERATTPLVLLENIFDLEPDAFCSIYTNEPAVAREALYRRGWPVEVYDKNTMTPVDLVSTIAGHTTIAKQRVQREHVATHLRNVQTQMETGMYPVIKYPTKKT